MEPGVARERVLPLLESLSHEPDPDVQYYAEEAKVAYEADAA